MKEDEFKKYDEYNKINEYKPINSENFNTEEYNRRLREYLKTKEININTQSNKNSENKSGFSAEDLKKTNNLSEPTPLTQGLKHTLGTVASTLGSSVVVVAASAAIVTNVFVPKPKIDFDFDVSYNSIEYRIEMQEVDENLDYYIILGNNKDSYRVEIPKDDNPDDHIITYDGYQDNLSDNEIYHMNVFGTDSAKGSTSNFYKTKFITKKYDLPTVKFDFKNSMDSNTERFKLDYNIKLDNYRQTNNKTYDLVIEYNGEVIENNEELINDMFSGSLYISLSDINDMISDTNKLIKFSVYENKNGNKTIIKEYHYGYKDFMPRTFMEYYIDVNDTMDQTMLRYFIYLEDYMPSDDKSFKVNIKYKDEILFNAGFYNEHFESEFLIDNLIFEELMSDFNNKLKIEVIEVRENMERVIKEEFIDLSHYQPEVDFLITPTLTVDRSNINMHYEAMLRNIKPNTYAGYKLEIKYNNQIIEENYNLTLDGFTNDFIIDRLIVNKLLYSDNKIITIEVKEIINGEETVIANNEVDFNDYLTEPTFNLEQVYNKDLVTMDINYEVILNNDVRLFNNYELWMEQNGERSLVSTDYRLGKFTGVLRGVKEGEVRLFVKTDFDNEPLEIGSKIENIIYPQVDLSTAVVNFTPTFDKANRTSRLTIHNTIIDKKQLDDYELIVKDINDNIIQQIMISLDNEDFNLDNLKTGTYKIIINELKAGQTYKIKEETYEMVYPNDFFTNITTASVDFTPNFDSVNKVTDLTIKPVIDNKLPDNFYFIKVFKGNYFNYQSNDFKIADNFTHTFNNLKPGTYKVQVFIKEIMATSLIYEFDYNYEYPVNHLESLFEARCDVLEDFDYPNKLSPLKITPVINDVFNGSSFKLEITNANGYNYMSEAFKVSDNFSYTIPNAKEGEYQFRLIAILDGVEYDISQETYMQSYPNDFDPLPDNNLATYNKITNNDITVDAKTKPGYLLINIPINYHCDDSRFYYEVELFKGMTTYAKMTDLTSQNVVLEVSDTIEDYAHLNIYFKVREGWREKTVETYSLPEHLSLGGPVINVGNYKLVQDGKIEIPYTITYDDTLDTINSITYTVLFNDGYKVNNTIDFDPNQKELIITGFNQNVKSMTINMSINYNASYGIGVRDKAIEEVSVTFPVEAILTRSLVRALSARETTNNIELDFAYFGEPGLTLVIEENGVELHRGGFNYVGPLDNTTTTYDYYMVDNLGNMVGNVTHLPIDAASFPPYSINTLTNEDVLVTYNDDGTYNYYLDLGFSVPQATCYYVVTFAEFVNGETIVYKTYKSRNQVFLAEGLPKGDYDVSYQVYYEENGITYLYTKNPELILSTEDINSRVYTKFTHGTEPTLEITFYKEFAFDKTSVVITFADGSVINLVESDFVADASGDLKVTKKVTSTQAEMKVNGAIWSKNYDAIASKTTIVGNRYTEFIIPIYDIM